MTTDADLLRQVGPALFGEHWQTPLARALDVSDRSVRRWAAGTADVPEGAWDEMIELLHERTDAVMATRHALIRRIAGVAAEASAK